MTTTSNSDNKIFEILENPRFRQWVLSDGETHRKYWEEWIANNNDYKNNLDEAISIFKQLQIQKNQSKTLEDIALWQKIEKNILNNQKKPESTGKILALLRISAVAAVLFILMFFAWQLFEDNQTFTADNEIVLLSLPDGSKATLNKKSSLKYSKSNFKKERLIRLEGEAFFEVKKGSKFSVITKKGEIEVLGTSFNVLSRKDILEVSCKTGSVSVSNASDNTKEILMPGDKLSISGDITERHVMQSPPGLWTTGIFEFDSSEIQSVLEELARQYNLDLVFKAKTDSRKYTGRFDNRDLDIALKAVCWPMKYNCIVQSNRLIVSD